MFYQSYSPYLAVYFAQNTRDVLSEISKKAKGPEWSTCLRPISLARSLSEPLFAFGGQVVQIRTKTFLSTTSVLKTQPVVAVEQRSFISAASF